MSEYFWVFVLFAYAGFVAVAFDLYRYVAISRKSRSFGVIVIAGLTVLFTKGIVMRNDPVFVAVYHMADSGGPDVDKVHIFFSNFTDDDYTSLAVKIRPEFPEGVIASIESRSPKTTTVFFPDPMPALPMNQKGDKVETNSGMPDTYFANYQRVRCDLPAHSAVELVVGVTRGRLSLSGGKITKVWVQGRYRAGYRLHGINQTVEVTD